LTVLSVLVTPWREWREISALVGLGPILDFSTFFQVSDASEGINIFRFLAKFGKDQKNQTFDQKNRIKFSSSPFWKNEGKTKIA